MLTTNWVDKKMVEEWREADLINMVEQRFKRQVDETHLIDHIRKKENLKKNAVENKSENWPKKRRKCTGKII